ncbi:MAG: superoxide dismutase [Rickettsiales bacterium]|jgi:Fe-Mn family superoxide dismutase|nr:superoxide dismutase [Rickettsiales bacterium]
MMKLENFPLKFPENALEPFMSAKTMSFHYGRHMAAYITNLENLAKGTKYEGMELEQTIKESAHDVNAKKIFNNAAQALNHDFFFKSLRAPGAKGSFPAEIARAFGSEADFKAKFKEAAMGVFGSGWAWLVRDGKELRITTTANADTPIAHGTRPIITLDVWEHAYYLDYQNRRAEYADAFLGHLANWEFAARNLG